MACSDDGTQSQDDDSGTEGTTQGPGESTDPDSTQGPTGDTDPEPGTSSTSDGIGPEPATEGEDRDTSGGPAEVDVTGSWRTTCEAQPDGTYARALLEVGTDAWRHSREVFDGRGCTEWRASIETQGTYGLDEPGATEEGDAGVGLQLEIQSRSVIPRNEATAVALSKQTDCGNAAGPADAWVPGVMRDVSDEGCALFTQPAYADCPTEFDIVRVTRAGRLELGQRSRDADACSTRTRPTTFREDFGFEPVSGPANTTLASLPPGQFLENLAVAPDGTIFVTSLNDNRVYRLDAAGFGPFAELPSGAVGVALDGSGGAFVTTIDATGPGIYHVDAEGVVTPRIPSADAGLLNGLARLDEDTYLITDSRAFVIWAYAPSTDTLTVWADDAALTVPDDLGLGPNGLKVHDGLVYAANARRGTLLRYDPTVEPHIAEVAEVGGPIDDFAVHADGTIYATSHDEFLYIVRGAFSLEEPQVDLTFAGPDEGMLGCTSAAFGVSDAWDQLLVVTDGGLFQSEIPGSPIEPEPALLVELDVRSHEFFGG